MNSRKALRVSVCLLPLWAGLVCRAQQPAPQPAPAPEKDASAPEKGTPAPAPAAGETAPLSSDGVPSLALFYWLTPSRPAMRTGQAAAFGVNSDLTYPRDTLHAPMAMLSLPVGGLNTLRISYFRTKGQGNTTAGADLAIFGAGYANGEYLSVGYTLENAKISLDFLSWPFPVRASRKFRIKTLWELQYTAATTRVDAPLRSPEESLDSSVRSKNWFLYPTLGMGAQYLATPHFRLEAKGSGFGLPGRPVIWDADVLAAYQQGKFELVVGGKGFHFRTSPKQEVYVRSTLAGAYVGFRWYPGD